MRYYLTAEHIILLIPPSVPFKVQAIREAVAEVTGADAAGHDAYPDLFTRAAAYMTLLRDKDAIDDECATAVKAVALYLRGNGTTLSLTEAERSHWADSVHRGVWNEPEIVDFLYDHSRVGVSEYPEYNPKRGIWDHED